MVIAVYKIMLVTNFFCGSSDESEVPLFCFSTTSLSFMPNLHSGIPDRKLFITTRPDTWALKTWPGKQTNNDASELHPSILHTRYR